MRFEASIVGAKLKGGDSGPVEKDDKMVFRAPEDYAHLSLEERKELTQKMLGKHRGMNILGMKKNG